MYSNYTRRDKVVITVLLIIIISCILMLILNNVDFNNKGEIEYDLSKSKGGLPYPVQTSCANTTSTINVDGVSVTMTKVAKYKIVGRVESIGYHFSFRDIGEKLSTRDFLLSFGEMALDKNSERISYGSAGRYGSWYCESQELYNEYGGFDVIDTQVSNNHLVPATEEIKKIIESVKIGNVIEVEGYLAKYHWIKDNRQYIWGTSTSRTDSGDSACENIYVEKIRIVQ